MGGHAECLGQGGEHLGGGLLLAGLDRGEVRIGDPGAVGQVLALDAPVGAQHLDGVAQGGGEVDGPVPGFGLCHGGQCYPRGAENRAFCQPP